MSRKIAVAVAMAANLIVWPAFADVTGAYADPSNTATQSAYMILTQRGNTVLATYNLIEFPQPGLFNGINYTNVFMYGLGTIDPATQTARIAFSGVTRTACVSTYDLQFTTGAFIYSRVSSTCAGAIPQPKQFTMVF